MKARRIVLCVAVVALALLLGACQGKGAASSGATSSSQAASKAFDWKQFKGQEITLLLDEHPWTEGARPLVKEFEDQTGIKVNLGFCRGPLL